MAAANATSVSWRPCRTVTGRRPRPSSARSEPRVSRRQPSSTAPSTARASSPTSSRCSYRPCGMATSRYIHLIAAPEAGRTRSLWPRSRCFEGHYSDYSDRRVGKPLRVKATVLGHARTISPSARRKQSARRGVCRAEHIASALRQLRFRPGRSSSPQGRSAAPLPLACSRSPSAFACSY